MRRLRIRILLPILLLHLIVIPLLVYQFLLRFEEPMWDAQKSLGESVAGEIQNEIAITQMSSHGDVSKIQEVVDSKFKKHAVLGIRMYNSKGELRVFRGNSRAGKPYPENRATLIFSASADTVEVTRWVENEKRCYDCHDASQPYIGAIEVSIPVSEIAKKLRTQRRHAIFFTIVILIFAFSLIYSFHYHFIVSPVHSIMTAMARAKRGDLSAEVSYNRNDELGNIAESFNEVLRSLRQAKKELEEKHAANMYRAEQLAAVGEIAAGIAHEIKNPVTGIATGLEMVLGESDKDSPHKEILKEIIDETHRITTTINRLLDYARPKPPRPEWHEIEMIVNDIQRIFAPQCQKHGVELLIDVEEDLGQMFVDGQQIKQILMNVLLNSLEALSSQGAIRMEVTADQRHVTFRISDNGPGMDATTRARIFQPFFTTKPQGTGLGLAIVHRLVDDMGGAIQVDSHPGEGSSFKVQLPRECAGEIAHN